MNNKFIFLVVLIFVLGTTFVIGADELSASEWRLYELFEKHLIFLGQILAIVGGVFVGAQVLLQLLETKRNRSAREQFSKYAGESTFLITAMRSLVEVTTESQKVAQAIAERIEKQKKEALNRLYKSLNLVLQHPSFGFDKKERLQRLQVAEGAINAAEIHDPEGIELEPGTESKINLVDGHIKTFYIGDKEAGIASYTKVIENRDNTSEENLKAALLNRGISNSKGGNYQPAIDDFKALIKLEGNNLLFRFYNLHTSLLKTREGTKNPDDLDVTKVGNFNDIKGYLSEWQNLYKSLRNNANANVHTAPIEWLKTNIEMSMSSAFIQYGEEKHVSIAMDIINPESRNSNRRYDAIFLFLYLCGQIKIGQTLNIDYINKCLAKAEAYNFDNLDKSSIIVRKVIALLCAKWKQDNQLSKSIEEGLRDLLSNVQGSIFSPITQRKESPSKISEQLEQIDKHF